MAKGIQLSYSTREDIIHDSNLVEGMTVYALSSNELGDGGGAYYKIIDSVRIFDESKHIKLDNGLYGEIIQTSSVEKELGEVRNMIDSASETLTSLEKTVEIIKNSGVDINGLLTEVYRRIDTNTRNLDGLVTRIAGNEDSIRGIQSNVTSINNVNSQQDRKITTNTNSIENLGNRISSVNTSLYNFINQMQLPDTSMGYTTVMNLVPILDSDIHNLAIHIGEIYDTIDTLSEQIGYLIDYDYKVKNRIKSLEIAMQGVDPTFEPLPYPGNDEMGIDTEDIEDPNDIPLAMHNVDEEKKDEE